MKNNSNFIKSILVLVVFLLIIPLINVKASYADQLSEARYKELSDEYQNLLKDSVKVIFNYESHFVLQKMVYDYLLIEDNNDYDSDRLLKPSNIGIFYYDIDDDGVEEIFIYVNHFAYCGSHGCQMMLIKPKVKNPENLADFEKIKFFSENSTSIISHDYNIILKSKTNGFHDLSSYANDYTRSIDRTFVYTLYKWQGEYYDIADVYPASDY